MDQKKNGAPPSTYSEQFFSSGGTSSPREEAEAETERLKTRSDNPAGRVLFMEERFDREEARMERQREQLARERQAQFEQLEKERKAQLDHLQQVVKVVDQAILSGWDNLQRARELGAIANAPQPAKMSGAEGFVEVAKALFATGESLLSKVLERDPEAAQRLFKAGRQALGMPADDAAESPAVPSSEPATSEPASSAPSHPADASRQGPPEVVMGDVVAAIQVLPKEKIAELAAQHGVAAECLPVAVVVRAAELHSQAEQEDPA